MSTKEKLEIIWMCVPYILAIAAYLMGKARNLMRVPSWVAKLQKDPAVLGIIAQGVEAAESMKGKSDGEKQAYVRDWARSELYKLLGQWLPDSAVNFLIEHVIVRRKG